MSVRTKGLDLPPGVYRQHARSCPGRGADDMQACRCEPTYQAYAGPKGARRARTFRSVDEATQWRGQVAAADPSALELPPGKRGKSLIPRPSRDRGGSVALSPAERTAAAREKIARDAWIVGMVRGNIGTTRVAKLVNLTPGRVRQIVQEWGDTPTLEIHFDDLLQVATRGRRPMKLSEAIDQYIVDQRSCGRISSDRSADSYRRILDLHRRDVGNRDPRTIGREDVKRTLARWSNPTTQHKGRSILVSFYTWAMEEGLRKDNPALQTRRPKKRPTAVYRLTSQEAAAILGAAETTRERRIVFLGLCAGLRLNELRSMQGRHFERAGFVWVSADIAKGGRERWVPVLRELEPIVADIRATVAPEHFVVTGLRNVGVPGQAFGVPQVVFAEVPERPASTQAVWRLVGDVAVRAGIAQHIHTHLLRHAYGDHVAKHAGLLNAQALMGHADPTTTMVYVGSVTLEDLAESVRGMSYSKPKPGQRPPMAGDIGRRHTAASPGGHQRRR